MRLVEEQRRKDLRMGVIGGLSSGVLLFFALYAISGNIYTALFIPTAMAIGALQAYMSPRTKGERPR